MKTLISQEAWRFSTGVQEGLIFYLLYTFRLWNIKMISKLKQILPRIVANSSPWCDDQDKLWIVILDSPMYICECPFAFLCVLMYSFEYSCCHSKTFPFWLVFYSDRTDKNSDPVAETLNQAKYLCYWKVKHSLHLYVCVLIGWCT